MRPANIPGTVVKSRVSGGLPAVLSERLEQQLSIPMELPVGSCRFNCDLKDPTVPEFTSWFQLLTARICYCLGPLFGRGNLMGPGL